MPKGLSFLSPAQRAAIPQQGPKGRHSLAQPNGLGTREYRIDYLKYDFRRNDFVTERDNAIGWYNWLFRLLPIPLSRVIGAVAYGHWA